MTTTTTPAAVSHDTVALSKIALHPRNPRRVVGDVTDLAASLLEVGVLQDLVVAPWPAGLDEKKPRGAQYVLIAGHRRHAAAGLAKLKEVPVKVRADLDTLGKQLEAMLVENLQRSDLTPVEEADTYQAILDLDGLTQAALAKSVGQPVTRIRERLKLARLEKDVKEKVHDGQLTITDAVAIGAFADDKSTTKELLKAVGSDNFRWTLQRAERDRKEREELETKLAPYREAGVTIATHMSYSLPDGWRTASDITGGYPNEADLVKWDAKEHAECPGRTVLANGSRLNFACSQAKLHPRPKPKKSAAEVKREKEDRARRDAFAPSSTAATVVRRQHVAEQLIAPNAAHLDAARAYLLDTLLQGQPWWSAKDRAKHRQFVAPFLAVALDPNEDDDAQAERITTAAGKLTLEGLVLLHFVVKRHGDAEQSLAEIPEDGHFYARYGQADWITALDRVFTYPWSDWERETFNVDDALAPPAADGVDDDDETGAGS